MRNAIAASICLATIGLAGFAHAQNQPPITPFQPGPVDAATKQSIVSWVAWESGDDEGGLKFDVYFGTNPNPPLAGIDIDVNPYNHTTGWFNPPGIQQYSTTYYWRVVARDHSGVESYGPTWSYTTKALNEPPLVPTVVSPSDGETGIPINPTLKYSAWDFEGGPLAIDIYLGTDPNPPLVADDLLAIDYKPALLTTATLYYWRVVARDLGGLETAGPTWTFTTASTPNQLPDTPSHPYPAYQNDDGPTPVLGWDGSDPEGESLTFNVYLDSRYPTENHPLPLVGTTAQNTLPVGPLTDNTRYYWYVEVKDAVWTVKGPLWYFDNGYVSVLFSQFEARQADNAVEVRWSLSSDEAMDTYTLFRREGTADVPIAIASAAVQGEEGWYRDASVEPAKTYHYELLIRTENGDDYRSPVVTITTDARRLALYQNVPNPFNPQTSIRYDLPLSARVRLLIVDVAGRRVRTLVDEEQAAGSRAAIWNGRDDAGHAVASGVYFYVLDAGKQRLTRKLVLLK